MPFTKEADKQYNRKPKAVEISELQEHTKPRSMGKEVSQKNIICINFKNKALFLLLSKNKRKYGKLTQRSKGMTKSMSDKGIRWGLADFREY